MAAFSEKLSLKQERALTALLSHSTITEASEACGVSERQLWHWLKDPVRVRGIVGKEMAAAFRILRYGAFRGVW